MGEPSPRQIDECIAFGLSRRHDEATILLALLALERMTDADLAAVGVIVPGFVPPPKVTPNAPPPPPNPATAP